MKEAAIGFLFFMCLLDTAYLLHEEVSSIELYDGELMKEIANYFIRSSH